MTLATFEPGAVRYGPDGLVPAVVQDRRDGRVLMVAYMNADALAATLSSGEVHFHSRSRGALWRKGETSGNTLGLVDLGLDCDGDALLVTVDPAGPTCHRGTRSCFDSPGDSPEDAAGSRTAPDAADSRTAPAVQGFDWLENLWATIASRAVERPAGSYTTSLLEGGVDAVARKVTEEATEVLLAAKDDAIAETTDAAPPSATVPAPHAARDRAATRAALAGEAADLLYHTLVLLAERDVPPADVIGVLRGRHR